MFKRFRRKQIAELREVTEQDIQQHRLYGVIEVRLGPHESTVVSISAEDAKAGSPKIGDWIARNPKNNLDQWLVARDYFEDNFEETKE